MAIVRAAQIGIGPDEKDSNSVVDFDLLEDLQKEFTSNLRVSNWRLAKSNLHQLITALPGIKPAALSMENTINSVVRSLRDSPSPDEIQGLKQDLASATNQFNTKLTNMMNEVASGRVAKSDDSSDARVLRTMDRLKVKIIEETNRRQFYFGYAPLTVISDPALGVSKANNNGISARALDEFYVILDKQLVFALDHAYIEEKVKNELKGQDFTGARAQQNLRKSSDEIRERVFNDFVDTIIAKHRSLNLQVLAKFGWNHLSCVWLIPTNQMSLLRKSTTSGGDRFIVKNVNFAFARHVG